MRELIKNFGKSIGIVLLASIIGLLALVLVYCIPTGRIRQHVVESKSILESQNDEKLLAIGGASEQYDTGTNIIMLHEAIYPLSGHPLTDAMLCSAADYYSGNLQEWIDRVTTLASDGDFQQFSKEPYPRYWHGYLVFLKPLLTVFNLAEIYCFNFLVVVGSIIAIWYLMYKKLGVYSVAYIMMLMTMHVEKIYQSFQLSTAFYAMQITLLALLMLKKESLQKNAWWVFVLDGIVLAYLDFLTYPMLAFSVPILVYFLLTQIKDMKTIVIELFKNGVFFLSGYGGMWTLKWIYASLFTEKNVIMDAIESVYHRVGGTNMRSEDVIIPSRELAFYCNTKSFLSVSNLAILAVIIVVFAAVFIMKKKIVLQKNIAVFSCIGIILPLAWIFVVYNHCAQHPHLEWRLFCGVLFSLCVFIISLFKEMKDEEIGGRR